MLGNEELVHHFICRVVESGRIYCVLNVKVCQDCVSKLKVRVLLRKSSELEEGKNEERGENNDDYNLRGSVCDDLRDVRLERNVSLNDIKSLCLSLHGSNSGSIHY